MKNPTTNTQDDSTTQFVSLRQTADDWTSRTDSKAMTMLGVGGAILALAGFQTTQRSAEVIPRYAGIFFVVFCSLGILSCIASATCLWPRTQRKRLLREKGVEPLVRSPSIFWEMADLDGETFSSVVGSSNPDTHRREVLEQAVVTTWVAKQKLFWLRIALALFLGALISLFLSLVTSILGV